MLIEVAEMVSIDTVGGTGFRFYTYVTTAETRLRVVFPGARVTVRVQLGGYHKLEVRVTEAEEEEAGVSSVVERVLADLLHEARTSAAYRDELEAKPFDGWWVEVYHYLSDAEAASLPLDFLFNEYNAELTGRLRVALPGAKVTGFLTTAPTGRVRVQTVVMEGGGHGGDVVAAARACVAECWAGRTGVPVE